MTNPKFEDIRRRIINAQPCGVKYFLRKPGSWPYGDLILSPADDDENAQATFGDLTVTVNGSQLAQLVDLALGGRND